MKLIVTYHNFADAPKNCTRIREVSQSFHLFIYLYFVDGPVGPEHVAYRYTLNVEFFLCWFTN